VLYASDSKKQISNKTLIIYNSLYFKTKSIKTQTELVRSIPNVHLKQIH